MKVAQISVLNQTPSQYFVIDDIDDLLEYQSFLDDRMGETINKLMRCPVHPSRWNHVLNNKHQGDITVAHAIMKCEAQGGNPLLRAPVLAAQKMNRIKEHVVENGVTVIINMVGGYCFLDKNTNLISMDEYVPEDTRIHHIGEKTKIINFENDPELEKRTLEYFEEQGDKDPSYILNLRSFSKGDIVQVLKEFQKHGGTQAYIYTTGMDVPQMREYCEAIIEAGIQEVVFEFNSGVNDDIQGVVNHLQNNIKSVILL